MSDKCDVEACKRAYVTFNPADCTYKPTLYGPRQLCTKGTPPKPQANAEPAPDAAPPAAHPAPRAPHHPVPPGLVPSGR
ncbi:MAG: BA14K family protein [Pseudolabrys sp.]